MRRIILAAATAIAMLIAVPASADHCNGTVRTLVTPAGTVYMDDRAAGGIWLYVESNGAPGLQSGGASPLGTADACAHASPDTLLLNV